MKKINAVFAALIIFLFLSGRVSGQNGLKIDSLVGFPSLPDTAYQGHSYDSILVYIHNYSTSTFSDGLSINLRADSTFPPTTLLVDTNGIYTILPGAVTTIQASQPYHLDSTTFAAGDNIVVVWPSFRVGVTFPIDSLYLDVHLILVTGIDDPEAESQIVLSPVPARLFVRFTYAHIETIEQVRIYDLNGKMIVDSPEPLHRLDVSSYPAGLYYISILRKDGVRIIKKILKL